MFTGSNYDHAVTGNQKEQVTGKSVSL